MYYLADRDENYWGQVHVEIMPYQNTGFVDLLRNFVVLEPVMGHSYGFAELIESHSELPDSRYTTTPDFVMGSPSTHFTTDPSNVSFPLPNDDRFEADNDFGFDEPNSHYSEDNSESFSGVGDDSDDVSESLDQQNTRSAQP